MRTGRTWFNSKELRTTAMGELLKALEQEGLARRSGSSVELLKGGRTALAVAAIGLGASATRISENLSPGEFEDLASRILRAHSFKVRTRIRVRDNQGATELDVVGWRRPRALFIDCKRWPRRTVYANVCDRQAERVRTWGALVLHRMGVREPRAMGFPMVVTVVPGVERMTKDCTLVGADKLNSAIQRISDGFLDEMSVPMELSRE